MTQRISPHFQAQTHTARPQAARTAGAGAFGALMRQELDKQEVAFSKHAISRAEERGIEVTPALMDQLADTVERAQAKGATNILAIDANRAFIINVPNARVITAITQEELKESVFTNIDGAVIL